MELQDALIIVNGKKVTVADVMLQLKVSGQFRDEVCRIVESRVLDKKAQELRLEVTDQELYEFDQTKRRYWGLERAEDMFEYCRNNGIAIEQWQSVARHELLRMKVRCKVVEEAAIIDYFEGHREGLKTVTLSRIVCSENSTVEEVKRLALERGENFSDLARRYSVEENTRSAGGHLGTVRRGMLPKKVDEAVFAAKLNDVLGPFKENGHWSLFKVEALRAPELNDSYKKEIGDRFFEQWLQKAIDETKFERPSS